jgi:hypothetical protein
MSNINEWGAIKNVYTETYAESAKPRIYLPSQKLLVRDTTTCELTLLFKGAYAEDNEYLFYDYVAGQLIEYYDTFRQRYVTLLMTEAPTKVAERLYGDEKYREVKYKFTNVFGRCFLNSQMDNAAELIYLLTEQGYKLRTENNAGSIAAE